MLLSIRRAVAVFIVLLAAGASAFAADWDRGVAFYKKSDYSRALVEFQDIVREHPDVAGAWYYIGLCQFKLNRYKQVQPPMARAIDLLEAQSPDSPDIDGAWYTIGFSYFVLEDYAKAIEPLKRYVELTSRAGRPIDAAAERALGRSYFYLERYDDALPLLSLSRSSSQQSQSDSGAGATQAKENSQ